MLPSTARRLLGRSLRQRLAGAATVTILVGVPATVLLAGTDSTVLASNVDTDHDGLHDGIDPAPMRATVSLRVPSLLEYNGDAAGQELHDLLVQPGPNPDARWQVNYDTDAIPWLRLFPSTSYGVRPVYIGIDPQFHAAPRPLLGVLHCTPLRTLDPRNEGPGADVLLAIRPPRTGATRILWMLSESTPLDLDTLRGDADTQEALLALQQAIDAHRCFAKAKSTSDKITFERHNGWFKFTLQFEIACPQDEGKAAKAGGDKADSADKGDKTEADKAVREEE